MWWLRLTLIHTYGERAAHMEADRVKYYLKRSTETEHKNNKQKFPSISENEAQHTMTLTRPCKQSSGIKNYAQLIQVVLYMYKLMAITVGHHSKKKLTVPSLCISNCYYKRHYIHLEYVSIQKTISMKLQQLNNNYTNN